MAVLQPVPRKSITKQAALAHRLTSNVSIASHLLDSTMQVEQFSGRQVVRCRASEIIRVGSVTVLPGQFFYFIASKFHARFYIVKYNGVQAAWESSSTDERVAAHTIGEVKKYIRAYHAQKRQVA